MDEKRWEYIVNKATELRHALHRYPEPSMKENHTLRILWTFLEENTSLVLTKREGWFYAFRQGAGDPVAFRAEMDALPMEETLPLPYASQTPGVSHKCGHDGHCAALCALALALEEAPAARPVYLIFQPGEETGAGGRLCTPLLREKGIREIYAFHNLPGYPLGALVYRRGLTQPASEGLTVRLTGHPSHASAPEEGKNPAGEISRLALLALELAARPRVEMALCTVTGLKVGSGDFGISPGDGELCVTLRAERESVMKDMEAALLRRAGELAESAGLQMEFALSDVFPETRNCDACLDRVLSAAKALGLETVPMPRLWRASEDFGHFLKECPGALFYIGAGEDHAPLHTSAYDFPDGILPAALRLFLALARG